MFMFCLIFWLERSPKAHVVGPAQKMNARNDHTVTRSKEMIALFVPILACCGYLTIILRLVLFIIL